MLPAFQDSMIKILRFDDRNWARAFDDYFWQESVKSHPCLSYELVNFSSENSLSRANY